MVIFDFSLFKGRWGSWIRTLLELERNVITGKQLLPLHDVNKDVIFVTSAFLFMKGFWWNVERRFPNGYSFRISIALALAVHHFIVKVFRRHDYFVFVKVFMCAFEFLIVRFCNSCIQIYAFYTRVPMYFCVTSIYNICK